MDLENPTPSNYEDIWTDPDLTQDTLKTASSLFGSNRQWFVRESYISLYNDIINDEELHMQIVNGTAGIGKSAFLLYVLGRTRCAGKCALLWYHRTKTETAVAYFFPKNGGQPEYIRNDNPNFLDKYLAWYRLVAKDGSLFLVDGIVSFTLYDYPGLKFVTAKSFSCSIGWMEKSQNRRDRWLEFWSQLELTSYATAVDIPDAAEIVKHNILHLGGVCRYAFKAGAAQRAVMNAISVVGAKDLYKVVTTGLQGNYEQQKIVDRLIHRHPPPDKTGVYGTRYTFASEFVATRVAMALCLETEIETADLLQKLKGVGPAGSMRGVLFEAYAARRIAAGGSFSVKEIGSGVETKLDLAPTALFQKDTKTLNKTHYPPAEIIGKLVWPNPEYNLPAIDMFMLLLQKCIAFQMTVAVSHGLDLSGMKAILKYFDSVCRALFPRQAVPDCYSLYFAVPADVYDRFSNTVQPITGAYGVKLDTQEATNIGARVKQWIMKIE